MIELININKTYHTQQGALVALQNINLRVEAGEIFGVIGPSGAGKSTLIRCVNLLERPTSGKVIVAQQELTALSEQALRQARHNIGMIFQHFNLLSCRTVYENISLPLELVGKSKAEIATKVMSLLQLVGLENKKDVYPSQLSGGQKQRVAIARALANEPKVLLCDEATSALDPQTTHSILQLLREINKRLGLTILLITHEMNVVKEICHRLAILEYGEIVEQSEVIKFFSQPETNIAKEFVRASLKQHLPEVLQNRILSQQVPGSIPLLQISFYGDAAAEPFIAELVQKHQIKINILQANIENIRGETIGIMLVEADAAEDKIAAGIQYLLSKGLSVEIVGYDIKRNN